MKKNASHIAGAIVAAGAFGALVWLEHRWKLRNPVESTPRRLARNLAVAGVSAAFLQVAERPVSMGRGYLRLVRRLRSRAGEWNCFILRSRWWSCRSFASPNEWRTGVIP